MFFKRNLKVRFIFEAQFNCLKTWSKLFSTTIVLSVSFAWLNNLDLVFPISEAKTKCFHDFVASRAISHESFYIRNIRNLCVYRQYCQSFPLSLMLEQWVKTVKPSVTFLAVVSFDTWCFNTLSFWWHKTSNQPGRLFRNWNTECTKVSQLNISPCALQKVSLWLVFHKFHMLLFRCDWEKVFQKRLIKRTIWDEWNVLQRNQLNCNNSKVIMTVTLWQ